MHSNFIGTLITKHHQGEETKNNQSRYVARIEEMRKVHRIFVGKYEKREATRTTEEYMLEQY